MDTQGLPSEEFYVLGSNHDYANMENSTALEKDVNLSTLHHVDVKAEDIPSQAIEQDGEECDIVISVKSEDEQFRDNCETGNEKIFDNENNEIEESWHTGNGNSEIVDKQNIDIELEDKQERYDCEECGESFRSAKKLKIHKKKQCCDNDFTISDLSNASGSSKTSNKTKVTKKVRYPCDTCKKIYSHKDRLEAHKRWHNGEKLFVCDVCGMSLSSATTFIVHKRTHSGEKRYICNYCNKAFTSRCTLINHSRIHTGERPYVCNLCDRTFTDGGKLKLHMLRHQGLKPHVCDICKKGFVKGDQLKLHKRVHTGERPYTCDICNKSFSQKYNLTVHTRTVHRVKQNK